MSASRQIHLVRRPRGVPVAEDFAVVEATVPDAGEGQVQQSLEQHSAAGLRASMFAEAT